MFFSLALACGIQVPMSVDFEITERARRLGPSPEWEAQVRRFVDNAVFFANRTRNPSDIHDAWRTFRVWLAAWIDYNSDDWRLFLVWYVFHWRTPELKAPTEVRSPSIAEQFARACPEEISDAQWAILKAGVGSPMDFYEVHEVPGLECLYVKSLFLGYQHSYAFSTLPGGLKVGDIFFGKIIQFEDDLGTIACHSRAFPVTARVPIAYLRRQLISGRKEEFIKNFSLFESDLFNLYHDLMTKEV